MSGLTVAETTGSVGSLVTAWNSYITAIQNQANGSGTQADAALATTGLSSAVMALSNAPGFSSLSKIAGFVSGAASLSRDMDAYQSALAIGDSDAQNHAFAAIVSDGGSIGTAVGSGLVALSSGVESLAT